MTLARSAGDTFAGIRPADAPGFTVITPHKAST
jgi:hypothetical protein